MQITKSDAGIVMSLFEQHRFLWEISAKEKNLIKRLLNEWPVLKKNYPAIAELIYGKA